MTKQGYGKVACLLGGGHPRVHMDFLPGEHVARMWCARCYIEVKFDHRYNDLTLVPVRRGAKLMPKKFEKQNNDKYWRI